MPKIPTYSASLDYKPPRGDLDTAATPGRMLAKFGEAVGEFGGKIAKQTELAERMKQAAAETARANGTAQAMTELRQTIADFDADTDPDSMMDRYLEKADGIRQGIADTIADPQVRAQVEEDTAPIVGVQSALIQGDRVRRLTARGRQDLDNHLALYVGIAAGARHPLEHDDAVDLAVGEIHRKAEAGFITGEDAATIEQGFYADLAERQARRAIAADPQSALASLEGGEDFATLPADRRARLIDEADRAVQAQTVARTTAAAAARRETLIRLPGFLDALRDGDLPDDESFGRESLIATLGDEEGEKRWAEIEDARAFGKAAVRIRWASPDEISDLVNRGNTPLLIKKLPFIMPNPDELPVDEFIRRLPYLRSRDGDTEELLLQLAVDRRNEQLWSGPADYVLANPRIAELHESLRRTTAQPKIPAVLASALQASGAPAPTAASSDEDRRAATAAYANATLAEQERLGLPADRRQVLPEMEAQELVARILDNDPKTAAGTLSDLATDWGDAWPTALADLTRHGLPGEYRLLADLADPVSRQTLAKVLTTQSSEPGTLRAKAGGDVEMVDDLVRRYRDERLQLDAGFNVADIQKSASNPELAQTDPSQTIGDDRPYSTVRRSSDGLPFPPPPSPRPRGGFGGPKVAPGQSATRRNIEPKPSANPSPDIAETLKRGRPMPIWRDTIARLETLGHPYDGYGTSLADKNSRGGGGLRARTIPIAPGQPDRSRYDDSL